MYRIKTVVAAPAVLGASLLMRVFDEDREVPEVDLGLLARRVVHHVCLCRSTGSVTSAEAVGGRGSLGERTPADDRRPRLLRRRSPARDPERPSSAEGQALFPSPPGPSNSRWSSCRVT
jgi:hypothetical protein